MTLMLDTHILLWALVTPHQIPDAARQMLADRRQDVYFSAASIWEIAVKSALGKTDFQYSPDEIAEAARQTGFIELSVTAAQAARVAALPHYHKDPFDRLLVAQALSLPARLMTADSLLTPYSDLIYLL
jgi:PIN domain nuclease of toxin-antitoxin system